MIILKSMIVGFISSMASAGFVELLDVESVFASLAIRIALMLCMLAFLLYWRYSE